MTETGSAVPVRRALLSAWRKDGLVEFGASLVQRGVELLSTGGTARALREAGIPVTDVSEVTGFPEMMGGRVKTLHPKVHGGLLFRRDDPGHVADAEKSGIGPIDLVYVDLYPFEDTLSKPGATDADVVEMIDIGGPAMIRSAAKNHAHVVVLVDPQDLDLASTELAAHEGSTTLTFRRGQAARAFQRTAAYDAAITGYLAPERFPERMVLALGRVQVTRYGENPHQEGAVYAFADSGEAAVSHARLISGAKELSYNNYLDASAALDVVRFLEHPAASVIKHRNPCGAAWHESDLASAFERAHAGDPLSAFGGILAFNRPITEELARAIADPKKFIEVIVAPGYEGDAAKIIASSVKWGRNCRLLQVASMAGVDPASGVSEYRSISGGLLVQGRDDSRDLETDVATQRAPSDEEAANLRFAWEICRYVVSNAIVFVKDQSLIGVGAGQMSRVDSVELAARKAGERAHGAVMASDAFFPFADGVEAAHEAGITAVIQPGGSRRDADVIGACEKVGMAMVFTGRRHFRH